MQEDGCECECRESFGQQQRQRWQSKLLTTQPRQRASLVTTGWAGQMKAPGLAPGLLINPGDSSGALNPARQDG